MKPCQACHQPLSPDDLLTDPYTSLCRDCWAGWQVEAEAPLTRYGKPGTVCTSCGMGFGGVIGFDRHRKEGRCLSPAELKAKHPELKIKDGIWVRPSPKNSEIPDRGWPNGDFPSEGIPQGHPSNENA